MVQSRAQNTPEGSGSTTADSIMHEEANHCLHSKSSLSSDSVDDNNGPTVMKDDVTKINEPCKSSDLLSLV